MQSKDEARSDPLREFSPKSLAALRLRFDE